MIILDRENNTLKALLENEKNQRKEMQNQISELASLKTEVN